MNASHRSEVELRCHCGSLMARVTVRGIELKCRRCKRVVVVPAGEAGRRWTAARLPDEETTPR